MNSQVPSKVFCGEGPQLAWGEESAKRSGRVCAAPQGENVLDASMMAELIVTKKGDRAPAQIVRRNRVYRAEKPRREWSTVAVGGKTWEPSTSPFWFFGWGRSLCGYSLPQLGTPVEGKIGTYTAGWNLRIKAIRAIGRRRKGASGAVPLASIWLLWHPCNLRAGLNRSRLIRARLLFRAVVPRGCFLCSLAGQPGDYRQPTGSIFAQVPVFHRGPEMRRTV